MEIDDMMSDYNKRKDEVCKFDLGIGKSNNDYTYKFYDIEGNLLTDEERKDISKPRDVIGVCYDKDGNVVSQTVGTVNRKDFSTTPSNSKTL